MGNFRRDNNGGSRFGGDRSGGRRSFGGGGGGRSFGRSDDRLREMFKTVCSNCSKDCEVPFRPTTGKPVYCSDCFEKVGGRSSGSDRSDRSDFRQQTPKVDYTKQFEELNTKLDQIITLLTPKPKVKKVSKKKVSEPVVNE